MPECKQKDRLLIITILIVILLPFIQTMTHELGHVVVGYLLGGNVDAIQLNFFGGRVLINNLDDVSLILTRLAGGYFQSFLFIFLGYFCKKYLVLVPICLFDALFEGLIGYIGKTLHYYTANIITFMSLLLVLVFFTERMKQIKESEKGMNTNESFSI